MFTSEERNARHTLGERRAARAEKRGRVRDPSHLEMFGSRVSESKHRKQQPSASTSGGLLEVETIAADGDARGGGGSLASSPHVSGANGALLRSTSTSKDRRDHAVLAALFLAILAVENTASMLARRYAVGVLKLQFSKNAVLAVNELMKMAFSVAMEAKRIREGARDSVSPRRHPILGRGNPKGLLAHLRRVARHSPRMAVPALVYLAVNLISYPALERINASVFTAISQLKVLATAFFAVVMLGTPVSLRKWRTLTVMVLGVTLVSWESAPTATRDDGGSGRTLGVSPDYLFGVACAGAQTMLSGFGSVYFELVLKRGVGPRDSAMEASATEPRFSVWDRNVQLALWSTAIYLPAAWLETGGDVLRGWTPLVWAIALLHASGGVLVALSVLYSSSVTKTVAVCASLVLTAGLGNTFFGAPLNGPIALGCGVVILSVFAYRDDCEVDETLARLRADRLA